MLSDASFRVHPLAIVAALVLAACWAATGPAAEIAFGAHSTRLKPAKTIRNGRALVFDLRGVDASRLARATLVAQGKAKGTQPRGGAAGRRPGKGHDHGSAKLDSGPAPIASIGRSGASAQADRQRAPAPDHDSVSRIPRPPSTHRRSPISCASVWSQTHRGGT